MIQTTATATEMQNNFGRYLEMVINGNEVIVTKNGKEVGRLVPYEHTMEFLTDSLTGIIKGEYDLDEERTKRLKKRFQIDD